MSINVIMEPPFGSNDAFLGFLMDNQITHQTISEVMRESGLTIIDVPIGEMIKGQEADWLFAHAQLHQQIYDQIGLTGLPDLTVVDFKDESSYDDWMDKHSTVHSLINVTLGL